MGHFRQLKLCLGIFDLSLASYYVVICFQMFICIWNSKAGNVFFRLLFVRETKDYVFQFSNFFYLHFTFLVHLAPFFVFYLHHSVDVVVYFRGNKFSPTGLQLDLFDLVLGVSYGGSHWLKCNPMTFDRLLKLSYTAADQTSCTCTRFAPLIDH